VKTRDDSTTTPIPTYSSLFDLTSTTTQTSQALFCNGMTIDELIASGNYNVIDNRDGHLDGKTIKGTNSDDLILASDAGNKIKAKKGNDCVIGGSGDDKLSGGKGHDIIFGGDGDDRLDGGKQSDVLSCGAG